MKVSLGFFALSVLAYSSPTLASGPTQYSRAQTCIVPSYGNLNISDTPAILAAFKKCGNGGTIVFEQNKTYALNELTVSIGSGGFADSAKLKMHVDPRRVYKMYSRIGRHP